MINEFPDISDVVGGTLTASGTLVTIPAGRRFTANLLLSGSVAVAGNSISTVATSGTNAAPASGSVVARLNLVGLALTTVAGSVSHEILVMAPPENSITLEYTAGANGTNSCSFSGYFL